MRALVVCFTTVAAEVVLATALRTCHLDAALPVVLAEPLATIQFAEDSSELIRADAVILIERHALPASSSVQALNGSTVLTHWTAKVCWTNASLAHAAIRQNLIVACSAVETFILKKSKINFKSKLLIKQTYRAD